MADDPDEEPRSVPRVKGERNPGGIITTDPVLLPPRYWGVDG